MMRTGLLLSLFILGASGASFLKRPRNPKRGLKAVTPVKTAAEPPKLTATQKFKLFKKDNVWKSSCDLRGLALGGWFVPEKFINIPGYQTPDMPKNVTHADARGTIYENEEKIEDLCQLSLKIGRQELDKRMQRHLASFITEDDFKYIAKTGVNTLRIPVAYWNVIADPYEIHAPIQPEVSLEHLDNAMKWAEKHDLAVVLDLHASPGSQNGWEHSGCSGQSGLFKGPNAKKNQALSVEVVDKLAKRYAKHPALLGIEVINEPTSYDLKTLTKLYKDSYDAIRKHDEDVWVIVYAHNADRAAPLAQYNLTNLVLDKHNYACFGDGRSGPPGQTVQHHTKIVETWKKSLNKMTALFPTILGEWSLCHGGGSALKLNDWNKIQQDAWKSSTVGAVFWTYKTMTDNARWSYRVSQETVDVMGDLPRCAAEVTPQQSIARKFMSDSAVQGFRRHGNHKQVDVGYEWETELEGLESTTN